MSDKDRVHTGLGNAKTRLDWIPYTCVAFTDIQWEKDGWPVFLLVHCSQITSSDEYRYNTMCCTCTLRSLHKSVFLQALRFLTPHTLDPKLLWRKADSMPLGSSAQECVSIVWLNLMSSKQHACRGDAQSSPNYSRAVWLIWRPMLLICASMAVHYKETPTRLARKAQWFTTTFCPWSAFMAVLYWSQNIQRLFPCTGLTDLTGLFL